jgi:tetratricopeptide (TPR) repeat protein
MKPWCIALVLALLAPAAHADSLAEAKARYAAGEALYAAARYAEAIVEFQAAYDLSHRAAILYNLARAESRLGHEETAIRYLQRYLIEAPDVADAASIRSEIAARENALAEARSKQEVETAANRAIIVAAEAARRADEDRRRAFAAILPRWPGYTFLGIGLALCAGGFISGGFALSDANTISGGSGEFTQDRADTISRGQTAANVSLPLLITGATLATTGIALLISSWRLGPR